MLFWRKMCYVDQVSTDLVSNDDTTPTSWYVGGNFTLHINLIYIHHCKYPLI